MVTFTLVQNKFMTLGHPEVYGIGESPNPPYPDLRRPNVKASCSMFSQILKLIPRTDFERLVKETKAEHRANQTTIICYTSNLNPRSYDKPTCAS